MPKRSNKFQRLIRNIYEAMSQIKGGKVSESTLLTEPDGTKREIDVLIEIESFGHSLKIAVECRDRARKDDIEWIDSLIGKYRNLNVNKIIAVSKSGFSEKAAKKALDNNIDIRTFNECLSLDWMKEFYELRFGGCKIRLKIKYIEIDLFPFTAKSEELIPKIEDAKGNEIGTINIFLTNFYKSKVRPKILNLLEEDYYSSCKTVSDIEKKINLPIVFNINGLFIRSVGGSLFEIKKIVYNIEVNPEILEGELKHFKYGEQASVSIGSIDYGTFKTSLNIIQLVGSNLLQVSMNGEDIKYLNEDDNFSFKILDFIS